VAIKILLFRLSAGSLLLALFLLTLASYPPPQLAGFLADPIFNQTWLDWQYEGKSAPLWDIQNFTYTKTFDADATLLVPGTTVQLTFDGNKMAADVALNGVPLGFTNDMFLRTAFDASAALKPTGNVLTVTFTTSKDVRNEAGRWPACSE
jgi:beta-galactosidase/beta-glucuronidase